MNKMLDAMQHVTGKPPINYIFDNPARNNLGSLDFFASQALWAGCLDATDHLLSGSCRNYQYQDEMLFTSTFNLRAL